MMVAPEEFLDDELWEAGGDDYWNNISFQIKLCTNTIIYFKIAPIFNEYKFIWYRGIERWVIIRKWFMSRKSRNWWKYLQRNKSCLKHAITCETKIIKPIIK